MINVIIGKMNSGKTLAMVYHLWNDFLQGRKVVTNFDLNFPHYKINKDFVKHLGRTQPSTRGFSFGFDEFWIWFDARKHQHNTIVSYFLNQSSKDDTKIYITAQDNSQNDKRIRKNLHVVTNCSRAIYIDKKFYSVNDRKRILPPSYQDKLYIKINEFEKLNVGIYSELMPSAMYYIKARPYFKLYSTRQKIKVKGD